MNNSTEQINATGNQSGYWVPFEKGSLPNVTEIMLEMETKAVGAVTSWGLDPVHIFFQLLIGAIIILSMYVIFVKGTSGASNIFKPIFYIAAAIAIIIMLGI